jgi:hypothetical protein
MPDVLAIIIAISIFCVGCIAGFVVGFDVGASQMDMPDGFYPVTVNSSGKTTIYNEARFSSMDRDLTYKENGSLYQIHMPSRCQVERYDNSMTIYVITEVQNEL